MDVEAEAVRQVYRKYKKFIKENFTLSDHHLDHLEAESVLVSTEIQTIQAEKTDSKRVSKLLLILSKKGPRAFHIFVDAINEDFQYTSTELQKKLEDEFDQIKNAGPDTISVDSGQSSLDAEQTQQKHVFTSRTAEKSTNTDDPIPSHVTDTLSPASARRLSLCSVTSNSQYMLIHKMYTKIKTHLVHVNAREMSFSSPEPQSLDQVDYMIDELLRYIEECYKTLGVNQRFSLKSHIIDFKVANQQMKKQCEEMSNQRNKYAKKINQLETRCMDLECQLKKLKERNRKLNNSQFQTCGKCMKTKENTIADHKFHSQSLDDEIGNDVDVTTDTESITMQLPDNQIEAVTKVTTGGDVCRISKELQKYKIKNKQLKKTISELSEIKDLYKEEIDVLKGTAPELKDKKEHTTENSPETMPPMQDQELMYVNTIDAEMEVDQPTLVKIKTTKAPKQQTKLFTSMTLSEVTKQPKAIPVTPKATKYLKKDFSDLLVTVKPSQSQETNIKSTPTTSMATSETTVINNRLTHARKEQSFLKHKQKTMAIPFHREITTATPFHNQMTVATQDHLKQGSTPRQTTCRGPRYLRRPSKLQKKNTKSKLQ